jgi:predicted metal-dependent phosphotriesterase family hydrolase
VRIRQSRDHAIPTEVLPVMRERGVSEADIASMRVENPRTILEGGAPY